METDNDKKKVFYSLFKAVFICMLMILCFVFDSNIGFLKGVYPLKVEGLIGIVTAPLVHADFLHLFGNISALFVLYFIVFHSFERISTEIVLLTYFVPSLWLWFFARDAWHIGASGVVYALASFIFFSGILVKRKPLIAQSLVIVFLYGSIFWGIFPMKQNVSWEAHLCGFLLGLILAFFYKKELLKMYPAQNYFDNEEEEEDDDDDDKYWEIEE